ncbi:LacI family DNA-binding transcriptional regulator [Thioclava kandeliae]|uniref:Substrate-binding domain-containing protein n=1 Tax=Thioclava kandeliae TaxID=3070818 RepID=A0ABV1SJ92_9RHOB
MSDPAPRPASAAEVAALAGVSRSAVSRTFTDGASVSARTRAKVMAAAEALNYHVNHLARGLSKDASRPVCLLASNLTRPYHGLLLDALTRRLQAAGRMAMVINVSTDPQSAGAALAQALSYRASAVVVMSGTPPADMVTACIDAGQKVIAINRGEEWPGVHHIRIDYRRAMQEAVTALRAAGCGRIALAGSRKGTPSLAAREAFFIEACHAQGIDPVVWRGDGSGYAEGQEAAQALLQGQAPPEGIFCLTDLMACGLMDMARDTLALAIPRDLCVIGFDDIPQAGWAGYGLTSFGQPYDRIAARVEEILLGEEPASRLETPLIWRQSVRSAKEPPRG